MAAIFGYTRGVKLKQFKDMTQLITLVQHESNRTPKANLEAFSFYLINHTEIEEFGHRLVRIIVFIDHDKNAHGLTPGKYWNGNYALDIVKKLDKVTLTADI